jgi:MSHA biogenesis protein MshQ
MKQQGTNHRHAWLNIVCWPLLVAGLLLGNLAQAATNYRFSSDGDNLPAGCSLIDSGTRSYGCGVLTLVANDTITLGGTKPITITFSGAFTTGASNLINAEGAVADLNLFTNGVLTLGADTVVKANVVGTAAVNLGSASTLAGNLSTSSPTGIVTLAADSQVSGFIRSQEGAINLGVRSAVGGAVSAGAGVVTLDEDVRVTGAISTGAGAVTVGGRSTVDGGVSTGAGVVSLLVSVTLGGGITTEDGGITVGNQSIVGGAITSTGAGIVTLGANVAVAGGISTQAGAVNIEAASKTGGGISTQAGVVTLTTDITVGGDISTVAGGITIGDRGRLCGNVESTGAGVVVLTDYITVGGSVSTTVGAITIGTGSTVGSHVISGGVITLTGLLVGGNVSSIGAGAITTTDTSIGGNVSSGAGVITLVSSRIGGTVTSDVASVTTGSSVGDTDLVITIPTGCSAAVANQIDHFEFSYAADALTCSPQTVMIRACQDASCSSLFTDDVSLTLSPASGWTATAPAVFSAANTLLFSGGSATVQLRSTRVGDVSLAVAAAAPAAENAVVCTTSGCALNYADSGFVFDVPTLIAAKPQAQIWLSAVKKDDSSQACVPGFASVTRSVDLRSDYLNPGTGTEPVWVNGYAVTGNPTAQDLIFDSAGRAALTVRYDDAGQMQLTASYSGSAATDDSGLLMSGSDLFVSKPYGLCLQTDSSCSEAGVSASCPAFPSVRAGDPFTLRVTAVGWQTDGEALTAEQLCSGNPVTSNFQLNDIVLSSTLIAPVPGNVGALLPAQHHQLLGTQTSTVMSISEVGVFTLSATPAAGGYFGETVGGGESDLVGRFIPAYLDVVGSASLTPSCGPFSYQGQPMGFAAGQEPSLTVTGRNRTGEVTVNYGRGEFWRLAAPAVGAYMSVTAEVHSADPADPAGQEAVANRDVRLASQGTAILAVSGADSGDSVRIYRWNDQALLYAPAALPGIADYPFTARVRQTFSTAALTDADDACYLAGTSQCQPFSYDFAELPGSQVRLGRLRIGNAHGSELQALNLPLSIETWQPTAAGSSFVLENLDNCSAALMGAPLLEGFSGQLTAGDITASVEGPAAGLGLLGLTAPGAGNTGSLRVGFAGGPSPALAPTWLHYDWNGAGREAAQGIATFGIYRGPTPLIYRRELYR